MAKGRLLARVICITLALSALTVVPAANAKVSHHSSHRATQAAGPQFASLIMDAKTGAVLEEYNADGRHAPASLTKMMTLYLTFEALKAGRLQKAEPLRVSAHAAAQAPSKLGLAPGQTITVEEAILALTVKSANDVAVVLGEALGGTEPHFAELMTQKAHELGMNATTFRNASGLPNPGQVTTARDMATLARALIRDYPQDYHYFSAREFTFQGLTIPTHNHVVERYEGADGLKTGFTNAAGFNLVSSAMRDGHRLIGVVLGGRTGAARDQAMMRLLDTAFAEVEQPNFRVANANPPPSAADRPAPAQQQAKAAQPAAEQVAFQPAAAPIAPAFIPAAPAPAAPVAPAAPILAATPIAPAALSNEDSSADDSAWGVQVGAYGRYALANAAALKTKRAVPGLATATISVTHMRVGGTTLYRARLVGLSEREARTVCSNLRRHKSQCVLVAPGNDRSIAQVAQ